MITVAIEVLGGIAYVTKVTSKDPKEIGEHIIVTMSDHDNAETSTGFVEITEEN